jgi:hypothetical protein
MPAIYHSIETLEVGEESPPIEGVGPEDEIFLARDLTFFSSRQSRPSDFIHRTTPPLKVFGTNF